MELVRRLFDGTGSPAEVVLRWAAVATLPAFLVDTYLVKKLRREYVVVGGHPVERGVD
ncbi:hypothetical membrane spanning protein [Cutibacterium acnes JCM 18909]|nr:hypothetical membrane spanning protein [Cutibacterium acnes JCM 18909]